MTTPRLSPFLVRVVRVDGTAFDAIFYAVNRREALRLARAWAERMGHARVELVLEEQAA